MVCCFHKCKMTSKSWNHLRSCPLTLTCVQPLCIDTHKHTHTCLYTVLPCGRPRCSPSICVALSPAASIRAHSKSTEGELANASARVVSNSHEYFIPNIFVSSPRPCPLRERLFIFVLLQWDGTELTSCFFLNGRGGVGWVQRKHAMQQWQRFYSCRHKQQTSDKPTSHWQLLLIRLLLHKSIAPLHYVIFS